MPPPSKRRATRSPSPGLPSHYLQSPHQPVAESSTSHGLQIQAHEATLITGHESLARETETTTEEGGRMGRWIGSGQEKNEEVWVDRYDILNLLPSLPSYLPFSNPSSFPPTSFANLPSTSATPTGPTAEERGLSDLASDHEEEFYFRKLPLEEREELEKKRKRKRLERGREERMRLLEEQEAREQGAAPSVQDEEIEPSETQLSLMNRLHATLSSAQNPSLLEMRILTNHSNDPKFQFLKRGGKWSDIWERIKRGEKVELTKKEEEPKLVGGGGLAGLGGYGSSDSESEDGKEEDEKLPDATADAVNTGETDTEEPGEDDPGEKVLVVEQVEVESKEDRMRKEAKAERVREWARKRKEAREKDEGVQATL